MVQKFDIPTVGSFDMNNLCLGGSARKYDIRENTLIFCEICLRKFWADNELNKFLL